MSDEHIKLGNLVKDVVTDFEGIAVSRIAYLDGGIDFGIQVKSGKDEKMPPIQYVSAARLQRVDDGIHIAPVNRAIGFHAATNEVKP